jgi:undecaprenyl-phosphate galactose phosphotransferase
MNDYLDNTAELVLNLNQENLVKKTYRKFHKTRKYSYRTFKRFVDICAGLVGCLLLIPITVVVKIISVLNGDFDSIFFKQKRIGKNGKTFNMYKFRSMIPNADEVLKQYLKENKEAAKEYKKWKKLKNDPRITKIGKFLRKTSLDEVPQFINLLKGDMSLIGNRPYLPREIEDMGESYHYIILTRPGLTGLWQCTLRSNATFEASLTLESYYSTHVYPSVDFKIFVKTVKSVIKKAGAI